MGRLGLGHWWLNPILGWCIGAFANHALDVVIHEATHNLIFQKPNLNRWAAIVADLPNTFPAAMGFRTYHLKHHSHQGDYHNDADLASRWEARLDWQRLFRQGRLGIFLPPFPTDETAAPESDQAYEWVDLGQSRLHPCI